MSYKEVKSPVDFPALEKRILDFWEENEIFEKSVETRPEEKPFVFYEGPPTANGRPGIHHVISRTIKDFTCRYQTMKGHRVARKAGWDTHGLPVEIEVEKELGFTHKDQIEEYGVDKFNKKCRESVFKYLQEWNDLTHRMGYWVDLDDAYITYKNEYIETVWHLLSTLWDKGLLYQGFKILPYCSRCETALSSHEISLGYKEVKERSITAKFPLKEGENRYVLAWTTTPWTLPGNVALAVGADIDYVEVEQTHKGRTEVLYLAEARLEVLKGEYKVLRKFKGAEMQGWQYKPLFDFIDLSDEAHKAYIVTTADFVTTEDGTGVVHTAVMYGEDDYRLGLRVGLPAVHTVDEQGCFNENVPKWQGKHVKDMDVEDGIIQELIDSGRLYRVEKYTHSYPHCWRCDSPLLYYAKKSWYLRTTEVKEQMIANNKEIGWFPKEVGQGRFGQWLENNIDWALSRDRYWGTPLNVWLCDGCDRKEVPGSVEALKTLSGRADIDDLHKPYIDDVTFTCPECGGTMTRTPEVLDCWFDSGAMPFAQFHYPFAEDGKFETQFPADFISEGVDQTRGWFYSLLAISTMINGNVSYKNCMSIELILDKNGQKMSKSKGNSVNPNLIFNNQGADPLRWYLFTVSPPWVPTRFDEEGVTEVQRKFFGTLANTYAFFVMYANIDDFKYEHVIPVADRPEIDRWLISSRNALVEQLDRLLSKYDVTKAARAIQEFVIDDLSNWYVRRNRRRFWKSEQGAEKVAAYQTLFETLFALAKMIAPFAPFLAEEIYRNLNSDGIETWESVHLAHYPAPDQSEFQYRDTDLENRMALTRQVVTLCHAGRNEAGMKIRQPLAKAIVVASSDEVRNGVRSLEEVIKEEVNVHEITFVERADALMVKEAKPDFRALGPKFGGKVNQVAEIIRNFTAEEVAMLENGEAIHVTVDGDKHGEVLLSDVSLKAVATEGLVVQTEKGTTVALDTVLTETLVAEGLVREFVNRVQNMRKEAGFEVTDRIHVFYQAEGVLGEAIVQENEHIMTEVLALKLEGALPAGVEGQAWKVGEGSVRIAVKKA